MGGKPQKNLTGQQFGLLLVLYQGPPDKRNKTQWYCQCGCPAKNIVLKRANDLLQGRVRSCGCIHKKQLAERNALGHKVNEYSDVLYDEHGAYRYGITSNSKNKFYFDEEDFVKIKNYCWMESIDNKGYHYLSAYDPATKRRIKMHYIIAQKGVDHIDRNTLNNRKFNLRVANASIQNINQKRPSNNTSGFIGVSFNKHTKKWVAYICLNHKQIQTGSFINKEDAIRSRLYAELKYFGLDVAPQKHLFKKYNIKEEQNA